MDDYNTYNIWTSPHRIKMFFSFLCSFFCLFVSLLFIVYCFVFGIFVWLAFFFYLDFSFLFCFSDLKKNKNMLCPNVYKTEKGFCFWSRMLLDVSIFRCLIFPFSLASVFYLHNKLQIKLYFCFSPGWVTAGIPSGTHCPFSHYYYKQTKHHHSLLPPRINSIDFLKINLNLSLCQTQILEATSATTTMHKVTACCSKLFDIANKDFTASRVNITFLIYQEYKAFSMNGVHFKFLMQ